MNGGRLINMVRQYVLNKQKACFIDSWFNLLSKPTYNKATGR